MESKAHDRSHFNILYVLCLPVKMHIPLCELMIENQPSLDPSLWDIIMPLILKFI